MNAAVFIALLGWWPLTLLLFALLPTRRAVLVSMIGGWLFLPMATLNIPGLPGYDRFAAIYIPIATAILLFDSRRLMAFRPGWIDLPVLIWVICPFFSSISNGLGAYDGLSAVYGQIVQWGLPYLIGRMVFNDAESLRDLAMGMVIGALIYVPLCLFEIKMSPQLHKLVYGFQQHAFYQTKRFGGYRPMVFMQHGIMVALWMAAGALMALGLSVEKKRIYGVTMGWIFAALLVMSVLCKSVGAVFLLLIGIGVILLMRNSRSSVWLMCIALAAPIYMGLRATQLWSGDEMANLAGKVVGAEKEQSLRYRMKNEDLLAAHARERLMFGWGGWSRSHVFSEETGRDLTIIDGLWIIALGQKGVVGLMALTSMFLLPVLLWVRLPQHWRRSAQLAGASALVIFLPIYMLDNLFNAMVNPIYAVAAGGVTALAWQLAPRVSRVARAAGVVVRQSGPMTTRLGAGS